MTTNLAGSLDSFGLDEVLSMLAMGGRSAHMVVSSPSGDGEVHLVDGHVSAVSSDRGRATLLRQVVGAADVSAADLADALAAAEPVRALVDSGTVERGFAHGVAVEQIVDALGEMLTWTRGEFAVHVGSEHAGDIGIRLPMDEAVDRGRGRAEEWTRVRSALPGEDQVLALAATVDDAVSLGREDWAVLVRVDGRRTLGEVVAAAGCAPLVASDRIVDLMGRGLVRVRTQDVEQPDEVAQLLDGVEHPGSAGPIRTLDAGRGLDAPAVVPVAVVEAAEEEPPAPLDAVEPEPEPAAVVALADHPVEQSAPVALAVEEGATDVVPEPVPAVAEQVADEPVVVEPVVDGPVVVEPGLVGTDAVLGEPALSADASPDVVAPTAAPVVEEGYAALAPLAGAGQGPEEFRFPVEVETVAWDPGPEPEAWDLAVDEPVATEGPVAGAVEWSPWAQALGLGAPAPEGELVGDPLAGPGIAEMIAGAHGMADTEAVPVPLAPAFGQQEQSVGAVSFASAAPVVPEPRASAEAAPVPVESTTAAEDEVPAVAEPAAEDEVPAVAEAAAPAAADPLAGGLLAQLMSGVRGL